MICFHGHFVGELKEIVSSPSYQIPVETGTSYMQLQKKVANLNFENPQKHDSVASCQGSAPPGVPALSHPHLAFYYFSQHASHAASRRLIIAPRAFHTPSTLGLVPVGCSFWNELFHSICIPLYSTHRSVSHHIPHSRLSSSFQPLLQPGWLCVDHSHLWILSHEHGSWVQIMLLEPTRTHSAELSM